MIPFMAECLQKNSDVTDDLDGHRVSLIKKQWVCFRCEAQCIM